MIVPGGYGVYGVLTPAIDAAPFGGLNRRSSDRIHYSLFNIGRFPVFAKGKASLTVQWDVGWRRCGLVHERTAVAGGS